MCLTEVAVLTGVCFLAGRFGAWLMVETAVISPTWASAGVALAGLLIFRWKTWPGVAAGVFLARWTAGTPAGPAALTAFVTAGQSLIGVGLLRLAGGFDLSLRQVPAVLKLIVLGAVVSPGLGATAEAAGLCASGLADWSQFETLLLLWWLADAMGILMIAPAALVWWARWPGPWRPGRTIEALVAFALLAPASGVAFGRIPILGDPKIPLAFVLFPLLIWIAFRLGVRGAATANLVVLIGATIGTLRTAGPFARPEELESLLLISAFMASAGGSTLLLGGIMGEWRRAQREQEASERRLEMAIQGAHGGTWEVFFAPAKKGPVEVAQIYLSPNLKRLIGFEDDELPNTVSAWQDRILPEDLPAVHQSAGEVLAGKKDVHDVEYRIRHKDGSIRWLAGRGTLRRDRRGRPGSLVGIDWDITTLKEAAQELRDERDKAQRYLDTARVILVMINRDERVELINRKGCEVLGRPAEQVVGSNWFDLALPARWREEVRGIFRLLLAGQVEAAGAYENPIVRPDGSERDVLWSNTVIRDETGQVVGTLSSGEDITERKRAEEALRQADRLKADFIRIAGHELRTPVSYLLGVSRLLRDCRDPDRLATAVRNMAARAQRLNEIILAMFKLMPGQLEPEKMQYEDFAVRDFLEEVRLECLPFVERRRQRVVFKTDEAVPVLRADREKLRDVIENLLLNAVKFTPDGGLISVRAWLHSPEQLAIAVQDQGHGVPASELPHIFEPFYSGGDVMQHSTGTVEYGKRGIGLGLTIVRQFVQMHGGTVKVESTPSGATFTVLLPPYPPGTRAQPAPVSADGLDHSGQPVR